MAPVVRLCDRRTPRVRARARTAAPAAPRVAIDLVAHPDAVSLVAAKFEIRMTPDQARELGLKLVELAEDAETE